jgi:DNA-binding NarL/FixJ family response regulator
MEVLVPRAALTPRERELVAEILSGRNNKAIAARGSVREQTVRNQLSVLFRKLGVSSRLELAVKLAKIGACTS